jgi:hypothetical protein
VRVTRVTFQVAVLSVVGCAMVFAACSSSSAPPPSTPAAAQCDATKVADKKSCTQKAYACELPTAGGTPVCCICIVASGCVNNLQYNCQGELNMSSCPGSAPNQGDPCTPNTAVCVYCAPTAEFVTCPATGPSMGTWTVSESAPCAGGDGGM